MTGIQWILAGLAVVVALIPASVWVYQRYLAYDFPVTAVSPDEAGLPAFKTTEFTASDGTPITVWITPPRDGKPVLLAFGGNFAGPDAMARHLSPLTDAGYGAVVPVYRGAHGTPGHTTEATLVRDAVDLYDSLDVVMGAPLDPASRIAYGFSLGTTPAVALAGQREVAGLVIEAGFDRLCGFHTRRVKLLPMCQLMWAERHDTIDRMGAVTAPLLMGHGALDRALYPDEARALFDAAPGRKDFRLYEDGTHVTLLEVGFAEAVLEFLGDLPAAVR